MFSGGSPENRFPGLLPGGGLDNLGVSMAAPRVYRITFMSQGRVYELYAKSVGSADLFGFIEVANLLWSQKSSVVIDPSEDSLKHEFAGVKRFYVPMHSVIRIDEVDHEGTSKIVGSLGQGGSLAPFPVFMPPGGDKKH
jgi:hypothetical protein